MELTKHHNIVHRTNKVQDKLTNNLLKQRDMKDNNDLDKLITSGILMSERKIKKRLNHYPWSPTLEASILAVSLLKLIVFDIKIVCRKIYRFKDS